MKVKTITAKVYGESSIFDVIQYDYTDIPKVKEAFDSWLNLKQMTNTLHGRSPNIPECITEVCLCLVTGLVRYKSSKKLKNSSFDCFDFSKDRTAQSKASSVHEDLTSFGPKSKWDDLYFIDFYNYGNIDGTFRVYKIPDELIYNCPVNRDRTLKEAQKFGIRPRINIKSQIIVPNDLEPVYISDSTDIMEHVTLPLGVKPVQDGIKLW